jgi:hypothetical protein
MRSGRGGAPANAAAAFLLRVVLFLYARSARAGGAGASKRSERPRTNGALVHVAFFFWLVVSRSRRARVVIGIRRPAAVSLLSR